MHELSWEFKIVAGWLVRPFENSNPKSLPEEGSRSSTGAASASQENSITLKRKQWSAPGDQLRRLLHYPWWTPPASRTRKLDGWIAGASLKFWNVEHCTEDDETLVRPFPKGCRLAWVDWNAVHLGAKTLLLVLLFPNGQRDSVLQ